jgi:probable F420-dependent oxidoreductase
VTGAVHVHGTPRFGVVVPNSGPLADRQNIETVARMADDLGFDSIWAIDHIVIPASDVDTFGQTVFEQLIVLSHVAGMTKRASLGTTVMVLPYRNAVVAAKMLATLDALSGGRLILGIGSGWVEPEFRVLGVDYESRGDTTDKTLEVMKSLWSGDDLDPASEFSDIKFLPIPVQRPHPPILVGGHSMRAFRRAVEFGQGWHPTTALPEDELIDAVTRFLAYWQEAGRKEVPEVALGIPIRVTDGPPPDEPEIWLGARTVAGPASYVAEELARLSQYITHFVIHPAARSSAELLEQVEAIGLDVVPGLRVRS